MSRILTLVFPLLIPAGAFTQTVHTIPFASSGNMIELVVANRSSVAVEDVRVALTHAPVWLKFARVEQTLSQIRAGEELAAVFSFSVEPSAPVGQEQTLRFVISSPTGEQWSKEIKIAVAPPEKFELFQNYPNPFNPSTTISYQLATASHVSLKVYNLLGQEVATLVNADRPAGYHEVQWNAAQQASGVYIYELIFTDASGNRSHARRAMLLLR
jgi:hypothetical protein